VLQGLSTGKGQAALLYMNAAYLGIATRLQDKSKHPVMDDTFVLVSGTKDGKIEALLNKPFLEGARTQVATMVSGATLLAAQPITDYRNKQIGVLVFSTNLSEQQSIMSRAGIVLAAAFLTLLVVPLIMTFIVLSVTVLRPVERVRQTIQEIAEDRAVLAHRNHSGNSRRQGRSGAPPGILLAGRDRRIGHMV
jgi:hypothetical protein